MQVQHQYALKQNFMKIEFENSIRRLSFLCHLPDLKIAWISKTAYSSSFTNVCFSTKIEFLSVLFHEKQL